MVAGFGRKLLAWFIDGWIFLSLAPAILTRFGVPGDDYLLSIILAFFVLRYLLENAFTTPGLAAMSIDIHDRVPIMVARREDAVSMGLGVVTILAGIQAMAVALGEPAPIPIFGITMPPPIFAISVFSVAILLVVAGFLVARVMMAGWWLVTTMLAIWILSVLTGWQAWHDLVVATLVEKRHELGLGLRPGEVEILPSIAKALLVLPASIVVLMLVATRAQFHEPLALPASDVPADEPPIRRTARKTPRALPIERG